MAVWPATGRERWLLFLGITVFTAACGGGSSSSSSSGGAGGVGSNQPPAIVSQPDKTAFEGQVYNYTVKATDPDHDALTFSLSGAPGGMQIGAKSGVITWTPGSGSVGSHPLTVTVTDSGSPPLSARQSFVITVEGDHPPTLDFIPNQTIGVGRTLSLPIQSYDPDPGQTLSYRLDTKASGMQIDSKSGMLNWTPTIAQAGTDTVSVTVTDSATNPQSAQRTFTVNVAPLVPNSGWTLQYVDSQELVQENGAGANAFDGDPNTLWHTAYSSGVAPLPHEIQINLGADYSLDGFRYLPRQDHDLNGRVKRYAFYVSSDGTHWGEPVATGTLANIADEQEVTFPETIGHYVRFVALSEVSGGELTAIAELGLLGRALNGNYPTDGTIQQPASDVTIREGDSVTFAGSGTEPNGSSSLSYRWEFGDPSIAASNSASPGAIRFDHAGAYVVTLTVTDAQGRSDPTPATRIVQVLGANDTATIDRSGWSIPYVDAQTASAPAGNVLDGVPATWWQTQSGANDLPLPHEIRFDLGSAYRIDGFDYLPRQDAIDGRIGHYELYVSPDGRDWGTAVSRGRFSSDASQKQLLFPPKEGRFIRLIALDSADGNSWTSAAEIQAEGRCDEPYVHFETPGPLALLPTSDVTTNASVCLDPTTHPGWGVRFTLDGNKSQVAAAPPYRVTFNSVPRAEHTLAATLVDSAGDPVAGSRANTSVNFGTGDYYVAIGDSITAGVGDDIKSDDISLDGRNRAGGYTPILDNLLTARKGYPQAVVMAGVPGDTSAEGLARLPGIMSRNRDAQAYLVLFGTNDASARVPSGVGLRPGDAGYSGSYKDRMQQIIDQITKAGKKVYLAKVPWSQLGETRNALVREYNQVIDELVVSNGITVTPPDFYAYFAAHPTEFANAVHPNGVGYQAMASLWNDALP